MEILQYAYSQTIFNISKNDSQWKNIWPFNFVTSSAVLFQVLLFQA